MAQLATESPINTLAEALAALGVTADTLTQQEKNAIDNDGYVVFEHLITAEHAARLAAKLDEIAAIEDDRAGLDFHTEAGTTRLGNLANKSEVFDICFTHPKVLAAVDYITRGDFGVSSLTGRAALPGEGAQGFHVDFHAQSNLAANILWALDDFTLENGATRLVPGSHRFGMPPHEAMDPNDPHADEVRLIVPAGTAAVIDAAVWHSGTRNNTDKVRHLLSGMCQPRDQYQKFAFRQISSQAADRIGPAAQFVLDHPVVD